MNYLHVILCCITTTILAMQQQQPRSLEEAVRPVLVSILTQEQPLSDHEIQRAEKLIKLIRVQSPAKGFNFQDKLDTRVADDSIKTDGLLRSRSRPNIPRPPSRSPSPLATCDTH